MKSSFKIDIPDDVIQKIYTRVKEYPWHEMPDDGGWSYGTNLEYMKELCDYWINKFNWREQEREINKFHHYTSFVNDINIHFIHEKGSGSSPLPLLISHGWPGSIVEFLKIIDPLAHPEKYAGNIEDAFDVIVPSLPGFGFSDHPSRPIGPRKMAKYFDLLMTNSLGYTKYLAQGGDWGGAISSWLGFEHTACQAIHINILNVRHPDGPKGKEEEEWVKNFEIEQIMENGYRNQQATKPQTLSYAMMDSPVGVAAWIIEKFNSWSDTVGDDIESVHSKDLLLTNIMIYLITKTFNTASWIYYGRREEGGRIISPEGKRVEVPTAAALFPAELLSWPPRSYVERIYNIKQWTEMPRGGHFAALEQPDLLIKDIRTFARSIR